MLQRSLHRPCQLGPKHRRGLLTKHTGRSSSRKNSWKLESSPTSLMFRHKSHPARKKWPENCSAKVAANWSTCIQVLLNVQQWQSHPQSLVKSQKKKDFFFFLMCIEEESINQCAPLEWRASDSWQPEGSGKPEFPQWCGRRPAAALLYATDQLLEQSRKTHTHPQNHLNFDRSLHLNDKLTFLQTDNLTHLVKTAATTK